MNNIKQKIILVLLACLCVIVSLWRHAESQHDNVLKQNLALQQELNAVRNRYQLTEEAYNALARVQSSADVKTRTLIKRIMARPDNDDAPLAPVLQDALEELE